MNVKEKYVLEHYEISKEGTVYSPYTKKFLKFREDKDGIIEYTDEGVTTIEKVANTDVSE